MGPGSDWSKALELSDLLVHVDSTSMTRCPVRVEEVVTALSEVGDRWGVRQVRRLPQVDGVLDPAAIDRLFVAVHSELSRLGQEFAQPARLRSLLVHVIDELKAADHEGPIRVVEIGCGVGYTVRWLARHGNLGEGVLLSGCDFNPALVGEAVRLAQVDDVDVGFECANAFRRDDPATILISSGVLHHFREESLTRFFAQHDPSSVRAFLHYDVTPSHPWIRWSGAWVFHVARMRLAVSRHDGVVSAMRAHGDRELATAAQVGAPWARVGIYGPAGCGSSFINIMRPVVGLDETIADGVTARLGRNAEKLVSIDDLP